MVTEDKEVVIVDEFTGRLYDRPALFRRLHQAIEAKEGVKVERESKTLATNYLPELFPYVQQAFRYDGYGEDGEAEFQSIYNLQVVEVPTHRPGAW